MSLTPVTLVLIAWAAMAVVQTVLFFVQRARSDAGVVDVGWAAGLGAIALFYAACASGDPTRRAILAVMAGIWSFRLAGYLLVNRVRGGEEDGRYRMLRERWGERAQRNFFIFFHIQALWTAMFSVPFLVVAFNAAPGVRAWDIAAIAVAAIAIGGESMADAQLARFRAEQGNRGRTCRAGLWRYSRHPNYFFEWIHWWAYVLLGVGSASWWVTLAGPAIMLLFLYKVTGIPYTEARAIASRGDDYRRYQRTTSAFIPWFPKKLEE